MCYRLGQKVRREDGRWDFIPTHLLDAAMHPSEATEVRRPTNSMIL